MFSSKKFEVNKLGWGPVFRLLLYLCETQQCHFREGEKERERETNVLGQEC